MNRYGQSLIWGPLSAPQLFTGDPVSYSYDEGVTDQDLPNAVGDIPAIAFHSQKAELNFEAEVTSGSTNFLDLSAGGAIAVAGLNAGQVLATRAVERWALGRKKVASVQATHFMDFPVTSNPAMAGTTLDAFTPSQDQLGIVLPGGDLVYGTYGLGHAAGIVHELTITQILQITEDEPSPDGKIMGAATHGYKRTISLLLLASPTAAIPEVKSVLSLTGAPDHGHDYRITKARTVFERMKGKGYAIEATWISTFGA